MALALGEVIRPSVVIESGRLSAYLGIDTVLVTETFQHTGSFKFRAAYNLASRVPQDLLIAPSSGNFGQALAFACSLLKKSCIIVMPRTSAGVKVEAVQEFGGQVELVDVREKSRAARVRELAGQYPTAYIASSYDDPLVIEGNSSLGKELMSLGREFRSVVVPVGGGGLISGIATGMKQALRTSIVGAEPLEANDAARSVREGCIVKNATEPQTVADGARTISLGTHNWEIIRGSVSTIVEVTEGSIKAAVRILFRFVNLKVEPTAALSVAALMTRPELFQEGTVCCVVSGGNVDTEVYARILRSES